MLLKGAVTNVLTIFVNIYETCDNVLRHFLRFLYMFGNDLVFID